MRSSNLTLPHTYRYPSANTLHTPGWFDQGSTSNNGPQPGEEEEEEEGEEEEEELQLSRRARALIPLCTPTSTACPVSPLSLR